MNIGFIGAGKVGMTLGKHFSLHGIPLSGYYSPHHAQDAADFTQAKAYRSLEELVNDSDALFLTVPDGYITAVYEELPKHAIKGKLICHCSGALSAEDAFPGIHCAGAYGYSVHPLFSVSDAYRSYRELTDVFFCVEGHPDRLEEVKALLSACGNPVQVISAESKVLYHAAAATASNHVLALVAHSLNLMEQCGFSREGALAALRPILVGNMAHAASDGPVKSLTGPVERCDTGTVRKHLAAMPTDSDRLLYGLLSEKLLAVAEEKHPQRSYEEMKSLLQTAIFPTD